MITFRSMSFRQILRALLIAIIAIILSFLILSIWSYRAFTNFIETDQREELVLGRYYERLISTWFQIGTLRSDSFLKGQPIDERQLTFALEQLGTLTAEIDNSLKGHPRHEKWLAIRTLLETYTKQLSQFEQQMKKWRDLIEEENNDRLDGTEAIASKLASLSATLAKAQNEAKHIKSVVDPLSLISLRQVVSDTLHDIENELTSHTKSIKTSMPGAFARSQLTELYGRIDGKLRALSGVLSSMLPSIMTYSKHNPLASLIGEIENFRSEFIDYRRFIENRRYKRQELEEQLLQLDESLRMCRLRGADLIVKEADFLWEGITNDANRLLEQIREKFWWRFVFLICSFVLVVIALYFLPNLLAEPIDQLRKRFKQFQINPGEAVTSGSSSFVSEFNELNRAFLDMVEQINRHIRLQNRYFQTITKIRQIFSSLYEMHSPHGGPPLDPIMQPAYLNHPIQRLLELVGSQIPEIVFAWCFIKSKDAEIRPIAEPYTPSPHHSNSADRSFTSASSSPLSSLSLLTLADHKAIANWLASERALTPTRAEKHNEDIINSFPLIKWQDLPEHIRANRSIENVSFLAISTPPFDRASLQSSIGYLYVVFTNNPEILLAADYLFLSVIMQNLATMIEMAELFAISLKELEISSQLRTAKEIQESALPVSVPAAHGAFDIESHIQMASEVGGDYYEFFPFPDGRLGVFVADASGKNVPAALLTMILRAALRTLPLNESRPSELMNRLNKVMLDLIPNGHFITAVYGVVDSAAQTFCWANAGHPPVILLIERGNVRQIEVLNKPDMPIGIDTHDYPEHSIQFQPGDRLVFFTDGVTDLRNQEGERFGLERLLAHLRSVGGFPITLLVDELDRFRAGIPPSDDYTLVAIRFRTSSPIREPDA